MTLAWLVVALLVLYPAHGADDVLDPATMAQPYVPFNLYGMACGGCPVAAYTITAPVPRQGHDVGLTTTLQEVARSPVQREPLSNR
jgi:hypothetical protein